MTSSPELAQLELLAQVDDLVERLARWSDARSTWEPLDQSRALVRRVLRRVETLRVRLEAPLVVATFGGTGTGKSTLVNALVGKDVTTAGRQRPTTMEPVLIAHPDTELELFHLPLDEVRVMRSDAPLLRDIIIIDCPDPDTSESDAPGTNLRRLHRLLPHCDVLLYTSTQQKYRSGRVTDELAQAATGCRLVFVQTHADLDVDIREDWRQQLADDYRVNDVFFVDSLRALAEQQEGRHPSGDFGRLLDLLSTQLSSAHRVRIRRANLLDLVHASLEHCRAHLGERWPDVERLEEALQAQRQQLVVKMADQLRDELLLSQNLWERRLLAAVTQIWGFSPFSSILRFYNGLGSFIASMSLYRARNSAQMALIGAVQGARWFTARHREQEAESQLERVSTLGLNDGHLRESQLVIAGYTQSARIDVGTALTGSLESLRHEAVRVEGDFLIDASRRIDEIIDQLAVAHSGWIVRLWYEVLFLIYPAYVLFRIGRNFFYETVFLDDPEPILAIDFYIPAGVFFVLISWLLVLLFTRRLRRGLTSKVRQLAVELAQSKVAQGLFPQLEQACREIRLERDRLDAMALRVDDIRNQVMYSTGLGVQVTPARLKDEPALTAGER